MGTVTRAGEKVVIEGVRKVSWATGEMCEFASSLVSALGSVGEDVPYWYVMGTSGAAFRFTLYPGEWEFGAYGILEIASDPYEPIRRAFAAAGYAYSLCEPGSFGSDAAAIMDSIDRGVPVLAFRVVGPSDCCVLTGYDQGGRVLLGWSTFQDIPDDHTETPDVTGYFRKTGWHDHIPGYILIGDKTGRPPMRELCLDTLKWAAELMRRAAMGRKATGLRGLELWAQEMTDARYFPEGDDETMGTRYVSTAINMTMLRDHCVAEPFLLDAVQQVPDFRPELTAAVACYAHVKRIRAAMDTLIADNFYPTAMDAIKDAAIRRVYAGEILKIRDVEDEAIGHIERLIQRCA